MLGRCAPSKARRFLFGESPDAVKPSQQRLPSIALKLAKSLKFAEGTALPTKNRMDQPQVDHDGWRNSFDEAYTGKPTGHRVIRNHLKY
jgi:hypothetical protein